MKLKVVPLSIIIANVCLLIFVWGKQGRQNPHDEIKWECLNCHTTSSWKDLKKPMEFNHDNTGFVLLGGHKTLACMSCHESLKFAQVGKFCADCHTDIHRGQFGIDCQKCHTPENWASLQDNFEIHAARGFPLIGVHAIADCQSCHVNEQRNEFAGTPTDCISCHALEFQSTVSPPHSTFRFADDCRICHNETRWKGATFDHLQVSGFEIRGAHITNECNDCHVNNQIRGLPRDCIGCHQADFNAVAEPNHVTGNFPKDCMTCHNENAWEPAEFNHDLTAFPLTGQHKFVECSDCHANNQYSATPSDCFSCHQNDFNGVSDPNHVQNSFSHDCLQCHNTNAWQSAQFDHSQTQFPLTGAHIPLECIACHANGYVNTPSDCFSCHQNDYNATTNPNHAAAGFPTDCQTCHITANWENTNWDHDGQYFPIYSGKHRNKWNDCAECHVAPNNFARFECIFCHEHSRTRMDDEHREVPNYAYESTACLSCHPHGNNLMMQIPRFLDRSR